MIDCWETILKVRIRKNLVRERIPRSILNAANNKNFHPSKRWRLGVWKIHGWCARRKENRKKCCLIWGRAKGYALIIGSCWYHIHHRVCQRSILLRRFGVFHYSFLWPCLLLLAICYVPASSYLTWVLPSLCPCWWEMWPRDLLYLFITDEQRLNLVRRDTRGDLNFWWHPVGWWWIGGDGFMEGKCCGGAIMTGWNMLFGE